MSDTAPEQVEAAPSGAILGSLTQRSSAEEQVLHLRGPSVFVRFYLSHGAYKSLSLNDSNTTTEAVHMLLEKTQPGETNPAAWGIFVVTNETGNWRNVR